MMIAQGGGAPLTVGEMRDAVSRLIAGVNTSDPQDLARELFRDDGEFSQALIEVMPRLVSAAAQAIKAFVESVENLPAEKGAELVTLSYDRMDGGEIGEAVNALSRLIIRLHEQNPELFPANRARVVADFMKATDFGKVRKALTYRAGEQLELLRREVEIVGDNPLALINIFSVVAPIVNDAVGVLTTLFEILALPPEAMTFALCKILEDIDWQEFAAVVNGAAALIVNLHRGNLIIGDGSLYTRGPLTRVSSSLVRGLDGQTIAEALAAIGEEGEALVTSLAGQVLDDQDLVVLLSEAAISLANSFFKAAAEVLERAGDLPPETMTKIARALSQDLEADELGRALNNFFRLGGSLYAEDPELYGALITGILSSIDPEITAILSPPSLGAGANRALSAYNRWTGENPGLVAEGLDGFLGAVDTRELERAARATGDQVAEAISRHPGLMKVIVKAVFSMLYGSAKGYVSGLRSRRKVRGGG